MDVFDKNKRSWIMSRVHGRDTQPELVVRSVAHGLGFRFRLQARNLPGNPDIVFPGLRKVIFVHGCFWHGHKGCPRSSRPSTNMDFWADKLDGNTIRDKRSMGLLKKAGWESLIVWQCQTKNIATLRRKLQKFLSNP